MDADHASGVGGEGEEKEKKRKFKKEKMSRKQWSEERRETVFII